jgi:hypothetical protein
VQNIGFNYPKSHNIELRLRSPDGGGYGGFINFLYEIFNVEVLLQANRANVRSNIYASQYIESFPSSSSFIKAIHRLDNGIMLKENQVFQNMRCRSVNPPKEFYKHR